MENSKQASSFVNNNSSSSAFNKFSNAIQKNNKGNESNSISINKVVKLIIYILFSVILNFRKKEICTSK